MVTEKDRYTATLGALRPREVPGHRPGRLALQVVAGNERRDVVLDDTCVTIGAHEHNGVVLMDDAISRVHCELRLEGEDVILRDLGSKNGTWIGSVRVHEVRLPPGGSFTVGGCTITLRSVDAIEIPLSTAKRFGRLHGSGSKMGELFSKLERLAGVEISVLVIGETGTGKELVARGIHDASARREGPFVVVDCTNLNEGTVESILFGHRKGTFTGAVSDRAGLLEEANGGTLFFDELGELPPGLQAKLLRALEQRETRRMGETQYRPFDARVIAATKRDILRMVADGRFRDDLYFRLAQVVLSVPPLRERGDGDITFLADMFLSRFTEEHDCSLRFNGSAYAKLTSHSWPGNVRELDNAVRYAAMCASSTEVTRADLPSFDAPSSAGPPMHSQLSRLVGFPLDRLAAALEGEWNEARQLFEKIYISRILELAGGNQSEAARLAGMSRSSFRDLLRRTQE